MKFIATAALILLSVSPALSNPVKKPTPATTPTVVAPQPQEKYTIQGKITVYDTDNIMLANYVSGGYNPLTEGSQCVVVGGFLDINSLAISVRDGKDELIATGEMGAGYVKRDGGLLTCEFSFNIPNLSKSDFYSVKLGRRGTFEYSFEQIAKKDWQMVLNIGL